MDVVSLLVWVLVVCLIAGIVWWAIGQIPMPPPVRTAATVVLAIILILVLLGVLTGRVPVLRL